MAANILIRHDRAHAYVRCRCEAEGHDRCLEQGRDTPCDASINYLIGAKRPNYPVPALRHRTFESLRKLGYVSALNNFDVDTVFEYYIKD